MDRFRSYDEAYPSKKNLYEKMNFEHLSTTKDRFRIDKILV
jgi:hypothetical protein